MMTISGADPGIYVRGAPWIGEGSGDRQGPHTGGPGQRPVGGPGGRSPPEAHEN